MGDPCSDWIRISISKEGKKDEFLFICNNCGFVSSEMGACDGCGAAMHDTSIPTNDPHALLTGGVVKPHGIEWDRNAKALSYFAHRFADAINERSSWVVIRELSRLERDMESNALEAESFGLQALAASERNTMRAFRFLISLMESIPK